MRLYSGEVDPDAAQKRWCSVCRADTWHEQLMCMAFHPGEPTVSNQTLTPGRIVHYTLSGMDCERINMHRAKHGFVGNTPHAGDVVPVIVVKVWSADVINGKALLDGEDTMWMTSIGKATGDETGTWFWPQRDPA
jgi:hypothetical protein